LKLLLFFARFLCVLAPLRAGFLIFSSMLL